MPFDAWVTANWMPAEPPGAPAGCFRFSGGLPADDRVQYFSTASIFLLHFAVKVLNK